jgi:hypothetical protein
VRNGAGTPFVAFCSPTFLRLHWKKPLRGFFQCKRKNVANLLSLYAMPKIVFIYFIVKTVCMGLFINAGEHCMRNLHLRRMKMKKVQIVVLFSLMVLSLMALLGSCASAPPMNTFMDTDVSVTDHAALTLHKDVNLYQVNNQIASGDIDKSQIIFFAPGEYTITVNYLAANISYTSSAGITFTNTKSNTIDITEVFLSGRFYYLYPVVRDKTVIFNLIDETDLTSGAAQKRVKEAKELLLSANYPSEEASMLRMQKAMAANPTLLEGTWVQEISSAEANNIKQFIFTGKAFVKEEKSGDFYLWRGVIEISGNSLSLTVVEAYQNGGWYAQNYDYYVEYWTTMKKKLGKAGEAYQPIIDGFKELSSNVTTTYIYNFSPEGNLQLVKEGEAPMIFLKE